jgi:hypothetical protein
VIGALVCSVLFLVAAGILWGVAMVEAEGETCPVGVRHDGLTLTGSSVTEWPPGIECTEGEGGDAVVHSVQSSPLLTVLIAVFLGLAATGPLAIGGALAIRSRRASPRSPGPISGA